MRFFSMSGSDKSGVLQNGHGDKKAVRPLASVLAVAMAGSLALSGCSKSSDEEMTDDYSYAPTIDTAERMDLENVYTTKGKLISGKESSQNLRTTATSSVFSGDSASSSAADGSGSVSSTDGSGTGSAASSGSGTDGSSAGDGSSTSASGTAGAAAASADSTVSSGDSDSILIKDVLVSVGDTVKAGDVLYTIDTTQIEKDLETAEKKQALNDQQNALTQAQNQQALADAQAASADSYRDSRNSLNRAADTTNEAIQDQLKDDAKYQQYVKEEEEKKTVYDNLKAQADSLQQDVYDKTDLVTSLTRQRDARARELDQQNGVQNSQNAETGSSAAGQTGNVGTGVGGTDAVGNAAGNGNGADGAAVSGIGSNGASNAAGGSADSGIYSSVNYVDDAQYTSLSNQLTQAQYNLEDAQTALTRLQTPLTEAQTDYETAKSNRETYETQAKTDAKATQSAAQSLEDLETTVNSSNRSAHSAEQSAANAIASQNISKALADLDSEAAINSLKEKLENDKVVATMDGTVTAVNVAAGQYYNGSDGVVLDNLSRMKVSVDIDEKYISDLKVGTKARVKTDATGDTVLNGEVTFASPTPIGEATTATNTSTSTGSSSTNTNSSTSTSRAKYRVEVTLDELNDRLRIGMTANIDFVIASASNVIAVPNTALIDDGSGNYYLSVVTGSGSSDGTGNTDMSADGSMTGDTGSESSTLGWSPIEDDSAGSGDAGVDVSGADMDEMAADGGSFDMTAGGDVQTEDVAVTIGVQNDTYTEITSGNIQEGEQILDQSSSGSGDYSSMTDGMYATY